MNHAEWLFMEEMVSVEGETDVQSMKPLHTGMAANYYNMTVSDGNGEVEKHLLITYSSAAVYFLFDFGDRSDNDTLHLVEAIAYSFHRLR